MFVDKELKSRAMDLLHTGARMSVAAARKFGGQTYSFDDDVRELLGKIFYFHP